ncbi:MAG: hypothetical protein ACK4FG_00665 [Brevundimonas sp.]
MRDRDLTARCRAEVDGTLSNCVITDDNGGIVERTLSRSMQETLNQARMYPAMENGQPVVASVQIPVALRFDTYAPTGLRIADPFWMEAPSPDQIQAARPPEAGDRYGSARLDCGLAPDGRPRDCQVGMDRPLNRGFGEAAMQLAPLFRLEMRMPEGKTYADVRVTIDVSFPNAETVGDGSPLRNPTWVATPSAEVLAERFPAVARAQGIREGRATAACIVQADGHLGECEVSDASPAGVGFETTAAEIAPMFAVSPWQNSGSPTAGRRMRLPFVFVDTAVALPVASSSE